MDQEQIGQTTPEVIPTGDVQHTDLSALSKGELEVLLSSAKEGFTGSGSVEEIEAALAKKG